MPAKLNTVIQPLMGGIRREADALLQQVAAHGLAELVMLCSARTPSPNDRCCCMICWLRTAACSLLRRKLLSCQ